MVPVAFLTNPSTFKIMKDCSLQGVLCDTITLFTDGASQNICALAGLTNATAGSLVFASGFDLPLKAGQSISWAGNGGAVTLFFDKDPRV